MKEEVTKAAQHSRYCCLFSLQVFWGEKWHFGATHLLPTLVIKKLRGHKEDAIKQNQSLKEQIGLSQSTPCTTCAAKSIIFLTIIHHAGIF